MTARKLLALFCLAGTYLCAQELGSSGKSGVDKVKNKQFASAIPLLEDATAETPNNPVVYEYLGLAYLDCVGSINGPQCLEKAETYMKKAIDLGGRATFIVDRSVEKGGVFLGGSNVLNVKRGLLHLTKTEVVFEPDHPDDKSPVITIPGAEIKEYRMNLSQGKNTHVFHIKAAKTYNFRTANFSADEAEMLFRLMEQYLGVSSKKK